MARLPQYQEQFIPTAVADQSAGLVGQNIAGAGQLLLQTGDVFQQRKLAKDMTKVSEMSTDFELQMQDEFKAFQQERASNPEGSSSDFDKIMKERKKEFLESSGLGGDAKRSFEAIAERQRANFGTKANNYETTQQLTNFANASERTAENNNLLAYRAGQDLALDELPNIENSVEANVLAASAFVPADQLEKMATTQTKNAYTDFIKGVASSNISEAKRMIEDKDIQDKIGDVESIDKLRSYIRAVENRQEQLNNDTLTSDKSTAKAAEDINTQITLESEFNKFNIGSEEGKDVVKNEEFNSINDMVNFRTSVENAYSNNQITDSDYKKYITDTTPVMLNMIQEGEGGIRTRLPVFTTSVNEQMAKDIKKQFKNNPAIADSDLVGIYEETYKQLTAEGIKLNSVKKDDKLKAQDLLNQNIKDFTSLRVGRNDANAAIVGTNILPLNDNAKTSGNKLDNGGYILMTDANGNRAYVLKDSSGNVIDVKEVKNGV